MNHACVNDLLSKENKHSEATCRRCVHSLKRDVLPKTKRLKTRKERSLMRGAGKVAPKTKSHHCHYHTCKDSTHFLHSCHHSRGSRREAPFAKVVPAVQEPSIITDSRLIGHHSLFNHKVKSVDIQRLVDEQGRLATGQQTAQAENHPPLAPHVPSPASSNHFLATDRDDVVPVTNIPEKEGELSRESDLTPGQRSRQQPKTVVTPQNNPPPVGMSKNERANPVLHKKGKTSKMNPTVDGDKKVKKHRTLNHTPKTPESHLSPNPLQLSSSPSSDTCDTLHGGPDSCCVSRSIATVASLLSDCVLFPRLRRRDLLAESRQVLMKALMEASRSNKLPPFLVQERRCDPGFSADLMHRVFEYDQAVSRKEENELMATDASASRVDTDGPSCFDTQNTTTIKHFSLKTREQPQQSFNLTATLLTSPEDSPVRPTDDVLRRRPSPQLHMDFEPRGAAAVDYLFTSSPASCWRDSQSSSWCARYKPPQSKESTVFNSFENSFTKHTRAHRETSGGPRCLSSRPFFPCQSRLMDRPSAEHFPLRQDPITTEGFSFVSTSPSQIHPPHASSHSLTFSQFSQPLTYPLLSSHQADMSHYPASHMLERSPTSRLSSLPSPETWAFPPMKLY